MSDKIRLKRVNPSEHEKQLRKMKLVQSSWIAIVVGRKPAYTDDPQDQVCEPLHYRPSVLQEDTGKDKHTMPSAERPGPPMYVNTESLFYMWSQQHYHRASQFNDHLSDAKSSARFIHKKYLHCAFCTISH